MAAMPLGAPDREIAVPLGSLCRSAVKRRPDDPRAALYDLFSERYGDEGDLFCEFCLAQYDLDDGEEAWTAVMTRNTVAVIAINDHAPVPRDTAELQQTFIVEDGDLSAVPTELRPMVQAALQRKQTGELFPLAEELTFSPVPPPTLAGHRHERFAWLLLAIAAVIIGALAWSAGL